MAAESAPTWSSFEEYLTVGDSCSRGAVEALSAAAAEVTSSFQAPSPSNPQSPQQQSQRKRHQENRGRNGGRNIFSRAWGPTHSASNSSDDSNHNTTSTTGGDNLSSSSAERGGGAATNPQGGGGGATTSLSSSSQQREGPSLTSPIADFDKKPRRDGGTTTTAANTAMNEFWERAGSISRKLSFEYIEQACLAVHCRSPVTAKEAQATASSTTIATASLTTTQQPQTPNNTSSSSPPNELAQARQWALNASLHTAPEGGATVSNHTTPPPSPNQNPPKTTGNSTITTDLPQHQQKQARQHDEIEVLPNHRVQVRLPPTHPGDAPKKAKGGAGSPPVDTLLLNVSSHLERSISELTMRSSYAATCESLNKLPDNRRMAYYAVGKNHRPAGTSSSNASHPLAAQLNRTGCNRRCYFTGKLILGGAVFYAGTVQQGLRTLVVFCLPYALGLPDKDLCKNAPARALSVSGASSTASPRHGLGGLFHRSEPSRASSKNSSVAGRPSPQQPQPPSRGGRAPSSNNTVANYSVANHSVANYSMASNQHSLRSRFSNSMDGDVSTIDCDLDPNWGLDTDFLLKVLPEAGPDLVAQMSRQYPDQFSTLPLQVRDPAHWKLYVKFCFFSGLPIAEGEMHYKVLDRIAELVYDGEEITLSHEVMEAVNGSESAEILTLPNQKAFRYLRKHYAQQCAKLDDRVFRRDSWERIAPEV